jgi:rhomboid protease GluP
MLERFGRKRFGSVVCPNCGRLVGVNDAQCLNCGRRNPGLWGFAPALRKWGVNMRFDQIVLVTCVVLFTATLLVDPGAIGAGGVMSLLSPSQFAKFLFGASGAAPIYGYHRWWTVLSAGVLHGSLLHIAFNMMFLRQIGPQISEYYGPSRAFLIFSLASVAGFLLTSTVGAFLPLPALFSGAVGLTVGASAGLFGLTGALVYYGRRTGMTAVSQQAWGWAVAVFLLGFVSFGGRGSNTDNWAHLGGYLGGWLAARWLDPLRQERGDHHLLALAMLVATVAAVVASLVTGWAFRPH